MVYGWRRSVFFSISPRRREFGPADDLLSCLYKKVDKEAPPTVSALRATRRCTPENGRGRKLAYGSDSGPGRLHFPRRIAGSTEGMGGALLLPEVQSITAFSTASVIPAEAGIHGKRVTSDDDGFPLPRE